jgi:hypothetical protein
MQKWEYMHIICQGQTHPYAINGQLVKDYPHIAILLNQLGDEGWELVSQYEFVFCLKRPKSN